jgi:RNA polymerase sigma-70 factor, ECF subfamily
VRYRSMGRAASPPATDLKDASLRRLTPRALRRNESLDEVFERFYRKHVAEVYQYALAVLGNSADAEDVTQQTFLNAYRAFQRGGQPTKPHNWLIKIAHNVCRMRWRQSGRRPEEVPLESAPEPAAPDHDKPSLDEVLAALARLPFNQRAAIVMREVEDRSYSEIAEVLGVTVPAVEALLFRARGNLRARRKAVAGALGVAPLPGSLGSFFGGSSGGLIAGGGAALCPEVALKVAAVVATGAVAGGLGYKAVDAVATPDAAPTRVAQVRHEARASAPTPVQRSSRARVRGAIGLASSHHSRSGAAGQGALRKAPTNDQVSSGGAPFGSDPQPETSAAPSPTAVTAAGSIAASTVGALTTPVASATTIVPPAATVSTPVLTATVTVPTVTVPPPPLK